MLTHFKCLAMQLKLKLLSLFNLNEPTNSQPLQTSLFGKKTRRVPPPETVPTSLFYTSLHVHIKQVFCCFSVT